MSDQDKVTYETAIRKIAERFGVGLIRFSRALLLLNLSEDDKEGIIRWVSRGMKQDDVPQGGWAATLHDVLKTLRKPKDENETAEAEPEPIKELTPKKRHWLVTLLTTRLFRIKGFPVHTGTITVLLLVIVFIAIGSRPSTGAPAPANEDPAQETFHFGEEPPVAAPNNNGFQFEDQSQTGNQDGLGSPNNNQLTSNYVANPNDPCAGLPANLSCQKFPSPQMYTMQATCDDDSFATGRPGPGKSYGKATNIESAGGTQVLTAYATANDKDAKDPFVRIMVGVPGNPNAVTWIAKYCLVTP